MSKSGLVLGLSSNLKDLVVFTPLSSLSTIVRSNHGQTRYLSDATLFSHHLHIKTKLLDLVRMLLPPADHNGILLGGEAEPFSDLAPLSLTSPLSVLDITSTRTGNTQQQHLLQDTCGQEKHSEMVGTRNHPKDFPQTPIDSPAKQTTRASGSTTSSSVETTSPSPRVISPLVKHQSRASHLQPRGLRQRHPTQSYGLTPRPPSLSPGSPSAFLSSSGIRSTF
jgi:hypothetical protein